MPVESKSAEYEAHAPDWQIMRDAAAGQRAVHDAKERYLKKLSGQDTAEYEAYRDRAGFYGATGRTIQALDGLLFRKDPMATIPAGMDAVAANIDGQGSSLDEFAAQVAHEIVTVGRRGLLVDFPQVEETDNPRTVAEVEALGLHPFIASYDAESILDYRTAMRGASRVLTMVKLYETVTRESADDEFEADEIEQVRVLDLAGGVYRVRLYQPSESNDWVEVAEAFPKRAGQSLTEIPFVFVNANGNRPEAQKPPLLDLANVNLSHYRNAADHEHGLHFVALPTPVITGHQDDDDSEYNIGAAAAWVLREAEAKAFYLEFTGAGLSEISGTMEKKEGRMAALGARMLAPEKRAAEAAETLTIRSAGENASLVSIANSVSGGMTLALKLVAKWMGAPAESIAYEMNQDYNPAGLGAQELTALLAAWQSGAMSWPTLFARLQDGEVIDADKAPEDELDEIENAGPATPPAPANDGFSDDDGAADE